jgi:hypothetical protein
LASVSALLSVSTDDISVVDSFKELASVSVPLSPTQEDSEAASIRPARMMAIDFEPFFFMFLWFLSNLYSRQERILCYILIIMAFSLEFKRYIDNSFNNIATGRICA